MVLLETVDEVNVSYDKDFEAAKHANAIYNYIMLFRVQSIR